MGSNPLVDLPPPSRTDQDGPISAYPCLCGEHKGRSTSTGNPAEANPPDVRRRVRTFYLEQLSALTRTILPVVAPSDAGDDAFGRGVAHVLSAVEIDH